MIRTIERSEGRRPWVELCLLPVLVILLAWTLYLHGLEAKSLWHDEFGTLTNAGWTGNWLDAIRYPLIVPTLPKPPLPFVLTRISLAIDNSVFAARLPSAVFALLTVPLLYVVGKSLFNRQVGLLAALLLAIAPLQIRYAQEARMYAMLAFFSLLSLYVFWRAIRSGQMRWWLGLALVTALNLYTHQFALLSLGVITLFGLWVWFRSKAKPALQGQFPFRGWHLIAALGLAVLLYLPMAPFLIEGVLSAEGLGGAAPPVYGELRWSFDSLLGAIRLFSSANNVGLAIYGGLFVLALVVLLIELWDIPGRLAARRGELEPRSATRSESQEERGRRWRTGYAVLLLLMWLVLPVAIVLSIPAGHGVRIRYLLFQLPVYLLTVAYGLWVFSQWLGSWLANLGRSSVPRRVAGITVTVALLGILVAINLRSAAAYYAETKQNWRDATDLVLTSAQPGDKVFVTHRHHHTGVLFYASQWDKETNPLRKENVEILPKDPAADLLPAEIERAWLIVPVREEYLPGGELDEQLKPYYQLSEPSIFEPSNVPQDSQFIGPISYRSLAVVQIVRVRPPSILFSSDDESVAQGACTWLRWEVENVREIYLDGEGVVGQGEREVCPAKTTAYELQVIHADGTVTLETIEIEVTSP